ncbi:TetR/AcrR family transcriptional regulator C-terminal domain-containing protein [Brachybacterium halotolerans subsp. kimchii]|uniref:TetR/AcrR family transcriptional regulator C-terminal domain-containing protein n=1 Tax=Brachybacterium halotolerans TaxID=2795215 RepID=UPI001E4C83D9|nr:TetR/AcrR family transcriptional regulator C-terminal domain-containing protein [Brachybacterium halotolerans]UEJ81397.1 TetR/AcrR family transcriptional regulator C-terminal domain-containing protein [Brachybacterium halotolerans subsp. kimchii]
MAKGITRQRIVEAALEVLDEKGADAVTVRAVASRLDVRAPALYWHVSGKQELLDEMGTEIQRRVMAASAPRAGASPQESLGDYARALRREYLLHRDGARTFSGTRLTDPDVLRAQEPWLEAWTAGGVPLETAVDIAELVTAFVVGFVIEEQERAQSAQEDPQRYDAESRDAFIGEGAPLVRRTGHLRADPHERFETQLAMVLAGVATRLGE